MWQVVVLDGWGEAKDDQYNAISRADTPCMDSLKHSAPERWMLLKAHGTAVGLPSDDDMGNSEARLTLNSSIAVSMMQSSLASGFVLFDHPCIPPQHCHCVALQVGHNALGAGQVVSTLSSSCLYHLLGLLKYTEPVHACTCHPLAEFVHHL